MANPTIAELQIKLNGQGLHFVTSLEAALKRVGGGEIRRQMNEQARALLGIETAAQRAAKATSGASMFSGFVGGVAKFGIAAMTVKRSLEMIGGAAKAASNPVIDFQRTLAEIQIKGGRSFTPAAMNMLSEGMKQRVREGSMFSVPQQAEAGVELAASGLSPQAVNSMLPTVLRFAQGSNISTQESGKILTNVANQFKIRTDDQKAMEKLGSQMVAVANMSTVNVQDIFHTLNYVGTQAETAGMDPSQLLAQIAILGNRGIKGSKAGTGIRNIFSAMVRPPRRGKASAALNKELGLTQKDFQEGFTDIPKFLQEVQRREDAKGWSRAKRMAFTSINFGQYGSTTADILGKATIGDKTSEAILQNLHQGKKGELFFNQDNALSQAAKQIEESGDAMKEAADIAGNTLAGRIEKLNAKWNLLQVTMGERFTPTIEKAIGWLDKQAAAAEKWISQNPEKLEAWGDALLQIGDSMTKLLPLFTAFAESAVGFAEQLERWGIVKPAAGSKQEKEQNALRDKRLFLEQYAQEHGFKVAVAGNDPATWGGLGQKGREGYTNALHAYEEWMSARSRPGPQSRLPAASESEMLGDALAGRSPSEASVVEMRIKLGDKGELQAIIDKLIKTPTGPNLRVGATTTP